MIPYSVFRLQGDCAENRAAGNCKAFVEGGYEGGHMKSDSTVKEKFPLGRFFAWKTRDISLGCMVIILGYLSLYASTELGIPVGIIGSLMMASKIFDAVTDLFAGYIIDNTNTRFGKARPYEFAVIGAWISTVALFSCPPSLSLTVKCVWLFCMYTLTYSIFATLLYGCQQAYIVRAFKDRETIIKVSSFGGIVSTLGASVVSISFPILIKKIAVTPEGWSRLVLLYAVPLLILGMLRFLFVKEVYTPGQQKAQEKTTVRQIFTMLKKNPYVWDVGIVAGSVQFIMGLGSAQYYFKFIVGDIGQYSKLQAMTILMLVFMFAFPKMIRKMSVGRVVILCSAVGIAGYIVNFFAGSSMAMLMVAFIVTGIASLPGAYLQAPMLMECSSYNEMLGLPRMDSTSAAVMNFMIKFMNALGAGLMGLLLQASGFIATKSGEVVTQPGSAMLMIRILYSIVPAAALFVVILAAKHFDGLGKKLKENGKQ